MNSDGATVSQPPAEPVALRVGLTGGVASGKTTVSHLFAERGVPVIDADLIAREVIAPGTPLLQQLLDRFGPLAQRHYGEPLHSAKGLDRALLRRLIFEHASLRLELEALLHPAIRARTEALATVAGGPYQIHVVPLLIETQSQSRFGRILVVDCPPDLQLARLMNRDRLMASEARAIIAAQASREARLVVANDVILNDGDLEAVSAQVATLHAGYLRLATQRDR